MQIVGKSGDVNSIVISLNSIKTNLRLVTNPNYPYCDGPVVKDNEAEILFKDSYEVDMLIRALERFKQENFRYFGEWRSM